MLNTFSLVSILSISTLFYYLHSIFFDIYIVGFVFVFFPNFLSYLKLFLVILPSKSKSLRL